MDWQRHRRHGGGMVNKVGGSGVFSGVGALSSGGLAARQRGSCSSLSPTAQVLGDSPGVASRSRRRPSRFWLLVGGAALLVAAAALSAVVLVGLGWPSLLDILVARCRSTDCSSFTQLHLHKRKDQDEEAEYTTKHALEISNGRCLGDICSYELMAEYTTIHANLI